MLMKIMLSIYIFILLYYPPIFGINTLLPMGFISWIYLATHTKALNKIVNLRKVVINYLIWSAVCVWMGTIILINNEAWGNMAGPVYWLVIIIPACLTISIVIKKRGFDIYYLLDVLLFVGTIQGLFAMIAFLFPGVKDVVTKILLEQNAIDELAYLYAYEHRLYGYASGLTFSMPVIQAFLAMIALFLSIYKKSRYFIYVPLLVLSSVINARSSIIICVICAAILIFLKGKNKKSIILRFLNFFFVLIVTAIMGIFIISRVAPQTYEWIITGIGEIVSVLRGNIQEGYFTYITDAQHFILPKDTGILFGVGARTLGGNRYEVYSDVGYINDIWFGGVFYCIIAYSIIGYYFYGMRFSGYKKNDYSNKINILYKFLRYSFTISFICLNIKMYLISINGFSSLFLLFVFFIAFEKKEEICVEEEDYGKNKNICYYTSI